ncbi:MAG TPA: ABC transporter substrate-binding protein, partial [Candidatus Acidoferrales bacterium]|nr:ABC transporter substrate-binding protein [Candidatus Acidoferrales bacterium]
MRSSSLQFRFTSLIFVASFICLFCIADVSAQDSITLGVVLPTTGGEAKAGQYQKEGIELAIKQINAKGGILVKEKGKKLPIKEIFYDNGTDSAKAAS